MGEAFVCFFQCVGVRQGMGVGFHSIFGSGYLGQDFIEESRARRSPIFCGHYFICFFLF